MFLFLFLLVEKSGTCPSENYTFERLENECPKLKSCELDKECAGDKRCCPYCAYGTKRCVDTLGEKICHF